MNDFNLIRAYSWSSKLINSRTGEEIASCKGWALEGKGWLNHMEGEHMELCHIGQSLVEVARPAAADNYTSLWGSNWYMMNSGEGISHLLREPLLAERLGLPPDFSLQVRHHLLVVCEYFGFNTLTKYRF